MIWPFGSRRALELDALTWRRLQTELPYLGGLSEAESRRMLELIAAFLSTKSFSGAHGLEPSDSMRISIAAQACLPVLHLGLEAYDDFVEVVVYPSAFAVQRKITDDDGLVHEFEDVLAGEAMDGGPVVLSWDDVAGAASGRGTNVVIHEFVHKLDMSDGVVDGCPPMPARSRAAWRAALASALDAFVRDLDAIEAQLPADVDPESEEADPWYAALPLDPYAATDEGEFFAVAAESFFVEPVTFGEAFPELYAQFARYFGQDPAARSRSW